MLEQFRRDLGDVVKRRLENLESEGASPVGSEGEPDPLRFEYPSQSSEVSSIEFNRPTEAGQWEKGEPQSSALPVEIRAAEGFDPAASAGLFVGISRFEDPLFAEVLFAVDDAIDLAYLFALDLSLILSDRIVLALAGEPRKEISAKRLDALLVAGARKISPRQTDLYIHLDMQRRAAGTAGLLIVALATHGFSDQGCDYLVASDSLKRRIVRTGVRSTSCSTT